MALASFCYASSDRHIEVFAVAGYTRHGSVGAHLWKVGGPGKDSQPALLSPHLSVSIP